MNLFATPVHSFQSKQTVPLMFYSGDYIQTNKYYSIKQFLLKPHKSIELIMSRKMNTTLQKLNIYIPNLLIQNNGHSSCI